MKKYYLINTTFSLKFLDFYFFRLEFVYIGLLNFCSINVAKCYIKPKMLR